MKLFHKILVLIAVPLVFQLVLGGLLASQYWRIEQCSRREAKSRQILTLVSDLYKHLSDVFGGIILWRTEGASEREAMHRMIDAYKVLPDLTQELKAALTDEGDRSDASDRVAERSNQMFDEMGRTAVALKQREFLEVASRWYRLEKSTIEYLAEMSKVGEQQSAICDEMVAAKEASNAAVRKILLVGGFLDLAICAALLLFFHRSAMARLTSVLQNVARIANESPPIAPLQGTDEFAQLDAQLFELASALLSQRRAERAFIDECPALIFCLSRSGEMVQANAYTKRFDFNLAPPADQNKFATEIETKGATLSISGLWSEAEQQWFCVGQDITAAKKAREERNEIARMVNHDLRAPLSNVLVSFDYVRSMYADASNDAKNALRKSRAQAAKMLNLAECVLDLERIGAGRYEIDARELPLCDAVAEAMKQCADVLWEHDVHVVVEDPEETVLVTDHRTAVRIAANLLFLAAEHAQPGSVIHFDRFCVRFVPQAQTQFENDVELSLCRELAIACSGALTVERAADDVSLTVALPVLENVLEAVPS